MPSKLHTPNLCSSLSGGDTVPLELALQELKTSGDTAPNICHWHTIAPRPATFCEFPGQLNPTISGALVKRGIKALYTQPISLFD